MPARKLAPVVPEPGRIRRIERSFGWIDHRILRDGFLEKFFLEDMAVYLFLILAANAQGCSWWRKDVMCKKLGIEWEDFEESKARLLERGLIAFRPFSRGDADGFYQVLPLPPAGGGS